MIVLMSLADHYINCFAGYRAYSWISIEFCVVAKVISSFWSPEGCQ